MLPSRSGNVPLAPRAPTLFACLNRPRIPIRFAGVLSSSPESGSELELSCGAAFLDFFALRFAFLRLRFSAFC